MPTRISVLLSSASIHDPDLDRANTRGEPRFTPGLFLFESVLEFRSVSMVPVPPSGRKANALSKGLWRENALIGAVREYEGPRGASDDLTAIVVKVRSA